MQAANAVSFLVITKEKMNWQFENTGIRSGVFNMEYDIALARALVNGVGNPTIRVYAWQPFAICDFILFPILWSIHQAVDKGQVSLQWDPLTLKGAGLFHIAMGAVLGIAAYGRTQEKLGGVTNAGFNTFPGGSPTFGQPQPGFNATPGNFGSPTTGGYGTTTPAPNSGFGTPSAPQPITVDARGREVVPVEEQPPL